MDALRATQKTRAEDNVGAAIEKRFKKFAVITRVVFKVGVLNEDDVASHFGEATAKCSPLTLILSLKKEVVAESRRNQTESLILAQDERWRRT